MSFQPTDTIPPVPPASKKAGRTAIGIGLIFAGVLAGAAILLAQRMTYKNRIDNLVRAVSGYTTDLTFEKAGTFTLYYESAGTVRATVDDADEDVVLDADPAGGNFTATLYDEDGAVVDLDRLTEHVSYDSGGHVGSSYREVTIEEGGDYRLEVTPDDPDETLALAVGIGQVSKPSPLLPIAVVLAGLLSGLAMLLLGRRAPSAPTAPASGGIEAMPTAPPIWTQTPGVNAPPVAPGGWEPAPPSPQWAQPPTSPPPAPPAPPAPPSPPWGPPTVG